MHSPWKAPCPWRVIIVMCTGGLAASDERAGGGGPVVDGVPTSTSDPPEEDFDSGSSSESQGSRTKAGTGNGSGTGKAWCVARALSRCLWGCRCGTASPLAQAVLRGHARPGVQALTPTAQGRCL